MSGELSQGIARTERGLVISGTRITLYDVLGYLHAQWSLERIREILGLTEERMRAALNYINDAREDVEAEFERVSQDAAAAGRYWEERNRERLAQAPRLPAGPELDAPRARLAVERASRATLYSACLLAGHAIGYSDGEDLRR